MSARDRFHNAVKKALQKEQWMITHDPLRIEFGKDDLVEIDLAAEHFIVAEKAEVKIAVEVKSFLRDSALSDFHTALGQFLNYRLVLEESEPERTLYLAVPISAYEVFFQRKLPQTAIKKYKIKLIVYEPTDEVIVQWID
ncbi:MAG: XisH family protein [Limnoraphis robusta]|uniref:Fatty-acid oxidation protein subunit alpha n=2 Tax=Limnoraphis robusta TaxID=1118279 RepID=A0A0F5Y7C0_9CYAN|nr:XisH family protein [Limnoraphis robusta]KKD34532.1 fatty-acid oxidation protein subunit alpha [Limnoraphis robusta CS-951]MEA5500797.1 XisH family protein [Limnoraphis robusta BA-68 BA1]MEA5517861.1 XisH family protein [Limnoraphis robusta CCNP1315]MEA5542116.1 XisH family protein [Limnoraphis robusta Tam1]MEA5546333.1 XisH family protein [Limnoraphis robusta CCNP1324]